MSAIHLESLDVSRCPHLDAISLLWLAPSSLVPSETSCTTGIKILKASRLPHLTNSVLVSIFHRFPTLTTLDISHSHEVTDAGIQDLVTCASIIPGAIKVTRRGETRDVYKRLFPQLLHLNLTGCIALTDEGIGWLEGCVNNLEVLELAGIGRRIQNGGIVRLFSSTPRMRRIDIEDCTSLGDEVLGVMESWKGLEWVVFNSCGRITDGGIRSLVEKCQTLTTLEVDSTSVEDGTISYFINSRVNYASTVEKKTPTLLSILDCPSISRRPTRDLQHHLRPRTGQRGYLSAPFTYHDPPLPPPSCLHLQECDSRKVVVRSFQNSLEVDRADRIRRAREESSEGMWGLRGRSQSESSRTGCIVM
jgi:F-box/leucine-rich repeat protein 2/20